MMEIITAVTGAITISYFKDTPGQGITYVNCPITPLPNFRCPGLGLIPKHDGSWSAIYHLSVPYGSSINSFISLQDCTLSYCSVDDAFAIVSTLGKSALMAKIHLKNAFHLIPAGLDPPRH